MSLRLLAFLAMLCVAPAAGLAAEEGLVLRYTFEEGAGNMLKDHSGNNLHGRIHGARWAKGTFGQALEFDGVDDFVECPYSEANDTANAFTVEAWAYPRRTGGGIFCRVTGGNWSDQRLTLTTFYRANKEPYFMFCISDGKRYNPANFPTAELRTWTHFAATFDGKVVRVYRNGVLKKRYSSGCKANVKGVPIWIGRSYGIGDRHYFQGLITDVRYYSRALTAAEIQKHHAAGLKGKEGTAPPAEEGTKNDLVLRYTFEEGAGAVLKDHSGNDLHGTVHGAKWVKGSFGNALEFDGKDDWVECAFKPATLTEDAFTVEAWIFPREYGGGVFWRGTGSGWTDERLTMMLFRYNEKNWYTVCLSDAKSYTRLSPASPELNRWTHLAATYDGRFLRLYRNGVHTERMASCRPKLKNVPIWIGRSQGHGAKPYFTGMMADVRYYRRALSAKEIETHYASELAGKVPVPLVRRATRTINLDGKLEPDEWAGAERLTLLPIEKSKSAVAAAAMLLYDKQNLYVAFECAEPAKIEDIAGKKKSLTADIWSSDCIEIFLDPEASRERYYHLAASPVGNMSYDDQTGFAGAGIQDESWHKPWSFASHADVAAKRWTLEVAIPFKSLGVAPPKAGDVWLGNFGRERPVAQPPSLDLYLWSRLGKEFNKPETFGVICFETISPKAVQLAVEHEKFRHAAGAGKASWRYPDLKGAWLREETGKPSQGAVVGDWPTYRGDNRRSGVSPENLNFPLAEVWVHKAAHPPTPAWPPPAEQNFYVGANPKLSPAVTYDRAYHPVVVGDALYYGSSADDAVYCVNAATGETRWSFFTEGPVRLAPTVAEGKVYAGSDDGHLYCLDANDGRLLWKHRAGPTDRRLPGNGRMISLWPVRSGIVVDGGLVYFCAGLFPSEGRGVYLCAVDTETDREVWTRKIGIAAQGHLVASPTRLFVPTGRSCPGLFDRKSGKHLGGFGHRKLALGNVNGGSFAVVLDDMFVSGVDELGRIQISDPASRERLVFTEGLRLIAKGPMVYILTRNKLRALDRVRFLTLGHQITVLDKRTDLTAEESRQLAELRTQHKACLKWQAPCRDPRAMLLAGRAIFLGGNNEVVAYSVDDGKQLWTGRVNGKAYGLAVSGGRLFVSTDQGSIHCFQSGAATAASSVVATTFEKDSPYANDRWTRLYEEAAEKIVEIAGVKKGYCLVLGAGEGRLAYEIAKRTEFRVIGVEGDVNKIKAAREKLSRVGLYGTRIAVHHIAGAKLPYQKYFANLIVSDEVLRTGKMPPSAAELFRVLRPCGGATILGQPAGTFGESPLKQWGGSALSGWKTQRSKSFVWSTVQRGRLPGAGEWTHFYADSGNTACSGDALPCGPTDIQWFGRPGPRNMADRHTRSVAPLYKNGRLFISGHNYIFAVDAYNGTVLWEREVPDSARLAAVVDCGNMVATDDYLYLAAKDRSLVFDPQTGAVKSTFPVPAAPDGQKKEWGYVASVDDILFGSATKPGAAYRRHNRLIGSSLARRDFKPVICSDYVFALNRRTGKELWTYTPDDGVIINPTLAVGGGRVYLVESANPETRKVPNGRMKLDMLLGKGSNLTALDMRTGHVVWKKSAELAALQHVIHLSYARENLLIVGSKNVPEGEKAVMRYDLRAFDARTGTRLWQFTTAWGSGVGGSHGEQEHHPAIVGDVIYTSRIAYNLRTGKPLKGWQWVRGGHGCGTISTSSFCNFHRGDMPVMQELKTGRLRHLTSVTRPGCWINMLPAGGLILIPEASSGCTCSHSIQTSLALVPRGE